MRLCAHCEPGLYAKVHCEPCCCGLSANHVNIMQSPLSPLHTYTHHWPFPFYCITVHSYRRQKESSLHCWREKACGCRQERALHIERLCGPICTARAFAHTEKFHHHHLYLCTVYVVIKTLIPKIFIAVFAWCCNLFDHHPGRQKGLLYSFSSHLWMGFNPPEACKGMWTCSFIAAAVVNTLWLTQNCGAVCVLSIMQSAGRMRQVSHWGRP